MQVIENNSSYAVHTAHTATELSIKLSKHSDFRWLKLPLHLVFQFTEAGFADPMVTSTLLMPIRRGIAFVKDFGAVPCSELRPTA
jgi:hypothetical protein